MLEGGLVGNQEACSREGWWEIKSHAGGRPCMKSVNFLYQLFIPLFTFLKDYLLRFKFVHHILKGGQEGLLQIFNL